MPEIDPAVQSALIGMAGIVIGALFAALPKVLETTTVSGRVRAEARKLEAEAESLDAKNELDRLQRGRDEIVYLTAEVKRLRRIILRHGLDPNESEPLSEQKA